VIKRAKDKSLGEGLSIFVAFHSNMIHHFNCDLAIKENTDIMKEVKVFGEMQSHKLPIRNV
jgi:hypothetical protein